MATGIRRRRKAFSTPLVPGIGSKFTGEVVQWGGEEKLVYRELIPEHLRTKAVPRVGPDGKELWHFHGGQPIRPMKERVVDPPDGDPRSYREYILVHGQTDNGKASKNFNFRADPEVLRARQAAAAREEAKDKILDAVLDGEIDPATLVSAIKKVRAKDVSKAKAKAKKSPPPDTGPRKIHKGFGRWDVMVGEEVIAEGVSKEEADVVLKGMNVDGNATQ